MCSYRNCVVNWRKKSTVSNHFDSTAHAERKVKKDASKQNQKQPSIVTCVSEAGKLKEIKDNLNRSLVKSCLQANIPLHKLSEPKFREWLVANVKGGGEIVSTYWIRKKYLPEIQEEFNENMKGMLKGRDIVVMSDETTNRKGEGILITAFKILPTDRNADPILLVPSVQVLSACTADTTSKAIIKALTDFDVMFDNVVAISSDSAPYMNKCVKILKTLVNSKLIHIQCWGHKLDKVAKVYSNRLPRLNECVKKCKKLFKNTRKRRSNYLKFLKDKR